jgi:hypothetical protein
MPIIGQWEREQGIPGGPTGPMADGDAFGAQIGRGLMQAGAGIQSLAADLNAVAEEKKREQEQLDRFDAQTKAQAFNNSNDLMLIEAGRNVQPGGSGLADGVAKQFDKGSQAFLKSVPESQRPYMQKWLEAERGRVTQNATKAEYGLRDEYQRGHVTRMQNDVLTEIYRDPSQVDAVTRRFEVYVDSTTLSPAEKETLKESGRQQFKGFGLRRTVGDEAAAAADAAVGSGAPAPTASGGGGVTQFVDRIVGVESGGNPNAKNPNSTATGLGQFIESTWLDMMRRYRPDDAATLSRGEQLELRRDPATAREMTRLYAEENAGKLSRAGHAPTAGNVYLTHFLGPGGALAVLGAGAGTPVTAVLPSAVVSANASILAGKTAGEVVAWAAKKMGGPAPAPQWSAADDPRFAGAPIADIMAADAAYAKAYDARLKQYDDARTALQTETNETMRLGMELGVIPDVSDIMESGLGSKEMADRLVQRREALNRAGTALTQGQAAVEDEVAYADAMGQPITREAITGLVDRGALSKADGAKWLNELTKREGEQANLASIEQRVAAGDLFDPLDADDRKGVDALWSRNDASKKLAAGDAGEMSRLARVVDTTGIIPKTASGVIAGLLRSDDAGQITRAVGIIDQLVATNPEAASRALGQGGLNPADRMAYETVRSLSPYLTPEQLVEKLRQLRDPGDRARREAVEKTAKEELKAVDDATILDHFDASWWSDPEVVPQAMPGLREDFDALYTHFRRAFDDPDGASDAALRMLEAEWGVSSVGGGQKLMKRPPEKVLPPLDGSHDWLGQQLQATVKDVAGASDLEGVHLVTTRDTLSDIAAGRSPRYRLAVRAESGEWTSPGVIVFDPRAAGAGAEAGQQQRRDEFTATRERLPGDMERARQITEGLGGTSGGLQ